MKEIEIIGITPNKINLFPANVVEEVMQNIQILLTTVIGSVPMDRNLGLTADFIDAPVLRAMMKARIDILESVQKYEPRVEVRQIDFISTDTKVIGGQTAVKMKVRIYDEYL